MDLRAQSSAAQGVQEKGLRGHHREDRRDNERKLHAIARDISPRFKKADDRVREIGKK
jgi:hypothetical protein